MEPSTFWLVALCLNQLRHRVPRIENGGKSKNASGKALLFTGFHWR
jgi:hypothetical protein